MFDPRTLCSPALFFHPLAHKAAALLLRAPLKGLPRGVLQEALPPPGVLEHPERLPVSNAHFLLLEDDTPRTLLALLSAWESGKTHRHLAFWIPRRFASFPPERTAAGIATRLLNGMLVPDAPELVSGWLTDHFKRPATWAEIRAVLHFFQGAPVDETVLLSADIVKFFEDHGGREPARVQFIRIQHQCLQALLAHHRDALFEKNLVVVVFARRESLLADHAGRGQWIQMAQALEAAVVPVSCVPGEDPERRTFVVHPALGNPSDEEPPAWIKAADESWRRVNPGNGDLS